MRDGSVVKLYLMAHPKQPIPLAAAAALALLSALWSFGALAQAWKPEKNVELIVPGGAGGGQDRTARVMQKIMQDGLVPTSVTVVNRSGGGSNLAYVHLNQYTG